MQRSARHHQCVMKERQKSGEFFSHFQGITGLKLSVKETSSSTIEWPLLLLNNHPSMSKSPFFAPRMPSANEIVDWNCMLSSVFVVLMLCRTHLWRRVSSILGKLPEHEEKQSERGTSWKRQVHRQVQDAKREENMREGERSCKNEEGCSRNCGKLSSLRSVGKEIRLEIQVGFLWYSLEAEFL